MSPYPLPPCSPSSNSSQTKSALADTENLLRQRNDAEGAGKSWASHGPTLFSSSFFAHALGWLMRVAGLYFRTTATPCGSGSQSQCLQPDAVQPPSRGGLLSDVAIFLYHGELIALALVFMGEKDYSVMLAIGLTCTGT